MIATWYVEAGKYDVHAGRRQRHRADGGEKPLVAAPRDRFVYYPGTQSVPFFAGPRVLNRPHSITADVEIPERGAEGVLLAQGTSAGGFTLLRQGSAAALHPQLGRRASCCTSRRTPSWAPAATNCASSSSRPATARPRQGPREPGPPAALHRRRARRRSRGPVHDAVRVQPRGADLRRGSRIDGHDDYDGTVPLQRNHHTRDGRPQRRADQRPRGRAQDAYGTPVA